VSYDLFFHPRAGTLGASEFSEYFSQRPHYKVEGTEAWYVNEDTGVYFAFTLQTDTDDAEGELHPVTLNINYFRPSFFGLEAEPEVSAFVAAFDLAVSDPQMHGMGDGEYDSKLFLSGWNHGNEFGYSALLRDPANRENLITLPADDLIAAWSWNLARGDLQRKLGEATFVPCIMFLLVDGQPATAAVWPDGIPIAVPRVDYLFVPREKLAPRKFLLRKKDQAFIPAVQALPILRKFATARPDGTLVMSYDRVPQEIKAFVEGLSSNTRQISGVSADKVLDRELVAKYADAELGKA
jgi:hypothetical protein